MSRPRIVRRPHGSIDTLPSGSLRVRVYAGMDPVSKRPRVLSQTIPVAGAGRVERREAEKLARQALRRLLHQVDEQRAPATSATVNQLVDRWLKVARIEPSTRRGYVTKINKHIRPALGSLPVARVDAETLDRFYAELGRCRDHCDGRPYVVRHWTREEHDCSGDRGDLKERCVWHACRPLAASSIRQIHQILAVVFEHALRWRWVPGNPARLAEPPSVPPPQPEPPTAAQASRIVTRAFGQDPEWGAFVWLAMTSGARRGELCALRWNHVDLGAEVMTVRAAIAVGMDRGWYEKTTKTHQHRRIALDPQTVQVLRDHQIQAQARAGRLGVPLADHGFVFSTSPDGSTWVNPDTATQRYARMTRGLGITTRLHDLRHYSATDLITAGVDPRTVAGRLGHPGGGATTLKVYSAWLAEADQRAALALAGRMPRSVGVDRLGDGRNVLIARPATGARVGVMEHPTIQP